MSNDAQRPYLRLVGGTDIVDGRRDDASSPPLAAAVSLMITRRQKDQLRAVGFTDDEIRAMTPAEAHRHLGL